MTDNVTAIAEWTARNAETRDHYRELCVTCQHRKRTKGQLVCSRCSRRDLT